MESSNGFLIFLFIVLGAFVAYNVWQENALKETECSGPFNATSFSYKICY